jgi:hypothetical protein
MAGRVRGMSDNMKTFSQIDKDAFRRGYDQALNGEKCDQDSPHYSGFAFGVRLLRSVDSNWHPGERARYSRQEIRKRLKAAIAGELSLLPSPAELTAELNAAGNELFDYLRTLPLPARVMADIEADKSRAPLQHQQVARPAAEDRAAKDAFDREAAAFILDAE